jgi:hypothetical protein
LLFVYEQKEHFTNGQQSKKSKIIHCEAKKMTNHVNQQCKQEAVEMILILPICRAGEKTVNYCEVLVARMKH